MSYTAAVIKSRTNLVSSVQQKQAECLPDTNKAVVVTKWIKLQPKPCQKFPEGSRKTLINIRLHFAAEQQEFVCSVWDTGYFFPPNCSVETFSTRDWPVYWPSNRLYFDYYRAPT